MAPATLAHKAGAYASLIIDRIPEKGEIRVSNKPS